MLNIFKTSGGMRNRSNHSGIHLLEKKPETNHIKLREKLDVTVPGVEIIGEDWV